MFFPTKCTKSSEMVVRCLQTRVLLWELRCGYLDDNNQSVWQCGAAPASDLNLTQNYISQAQHTIYIVERSEDNRDLL